MTIGERNREIVRLTKDGFRSREVADKVGTTEETVHQVMKRHRILGEEIFVSTKNWTSEKIEEPELALYQTKKEMDLEIASAFSDRIEVLKNRLRGGDKVKFVLDGKRITGEVISKSTHTVLVVDELGIRHAPMYKDLVGAQ